MKSKIIWNEETGETLCSYTFHGRTFYGRSICHPDYQEFKSQYVGGTIAEARAQLSALIQWRDCELKPGLKALKQLYYSVNTSKYYDSESYMAKMLQRQIELKEMDISTANEQITEIKKYLKDYVKNTCKVQSSLRRQRLDKNK